jgi:hypothetical protein
MKALLALMSGLCLLTSCTTLSTGLTKLRNYALGVYVATDGQRRVAEERAHRAWQQMKQAERAQAKQTRYIAVLTSGPTDTQLAQFSQTAKGLARSGIYTSAYDVDPANVRCVMVWDTETKEVVGKNCYAVVKLPPSGEIAKFDTYTAQYVASPGAPL